MAYIEDNKFSLLFCDKNSNVTDALHWYLPKREWIQVFNGDIFSFSFDAIVSPANSFGFMDGGFDKVILERLGSYIEKATKSIAPVPVGEARTIRLFQKDRPFFLIMAPTMEVPSDVSQTRNANKAMLAILREVGRNEEIKSVGITGLCTLTGRMSPIESAKQIAEAIESFEMSHGYL